MSDPYERAKSGRLTFKDGTLATRKSIEKKKKQKHKKKNNIEDDKSQPSIVDDAADNNNKNNNNNNEAGKIYSIDAAKNMKYEELFPVETKKFGYDPKFSTFKTVEDALDDRVKKKADRYCK